MVKLQAVAKGREERLAAAPRSQGLNTFDRKALCRRRLPCESCTEKSVPPKGLKRDFCTLVEIDPYASFIGKTVAKKRPCPFPGAVLGELTQVGSAMEKSKVLQHLMFFHAMLIEMLVRQF